MHIISLRSAGLSFIASLAAFALAPPAEAQCFPFSKWGMQRLPWGSGSTLTLGSIESGDTAIALRFAYDEDHDVRLEEVGHRGTRPDGTVSIFPYPVVQPPGEPAALWRAIFRPVDSNEPIEILPSDASWFFVYVDDTRAPRSVVFQWLGVELPDPLADSIFWAELRADIDPENPARVEWLSRIGRLQNPRRNENRYTLDEVEAPILHVSAPGNPSLARILVPIAAASPLPAENLPMPFWLLPTIGGGVSLQHPARDQQMQFSALYSLDPSSLPAGNDVFSSYRKILYLTTEDADGHFKKFQHRVAPALIPPATPTLVYRWAPVYYPTYGPTPWINFHRSDYPAVFEAIEAQSDAFWYDCTATYREFVDREMGLTRIADPAYAINPDFPRASPFVANSIVENQATDAGYTDISQIFPEYTDNAVRLQQVFDGADGRTLPTFMEWQKWLKGAGPLDWPYENRDPEDPAGPGFNPRPYSGSFEAFLEPPQYVLDEIARANGAGINASVYTSPLVINRDDWPSFQEDWLLRQRDGTLQPVGDAATGNIVDYGAQGVPFWMATVLYDDIFDTAPELGGVFFDVISGGGSFLRYAPEPREFFRVGRYHGGTRFVEGTQLTFDLVRQRIAFAKPTNQHPDIPFIPAETVQEYLAGKFDFGQQGLKTPPMQLQLMQFIDLIAGVPSVSADAQNPSPPLWNAVYHEWSRAEGLTVMLSGLGVSALLGGGQTNAIGLTWERWGDYMRYVHALWWFQGMKPTSFQYLSGYEDLQVLTDAPGGGVAVRQFTGPFQPVPPAQPQQLIDFLRRMHHALDRVDEAGKFLNTGRMERPLASPGYDLGAVLQSNALSPVVAASIDRSAPFASPGVLHFYENPISTGLPYRVPHVFHAVWRSVETGELGIVFVNWTDLPAFWQGTFDPSLYEGFESGAFTIHGVAPDGAGVTEYPMGAGNGPTTLAWNPLAGADITLAHHSTLTPGYMPARSIQVFVVRPQ